MNGGFGGEIEGRQRTRLARALRVYADRLIAAARPDLIGVGPVIGRRVEIGRLLGPKPVKFQWSTPPPLTQME